MSNDSILTRTQRFPGVIPSRRKPLTYRVTLTEKGQWIHAPGSDFLFAYLDAAWPKDLQDAIRTSFETALTLPSSIKAAVRKTSGEDVVDGLYLLDQPAMTKAMNTIDGMGETSVNQESQSGSGTALDINGQFFAAILGGVGGDVAPLMTYLTTEMGDLQAQTKRSTVTKDFGTMIGMISLMPVLNIPITTFQYIYSTTKVSTWFTDLVCASIDHQSYDYEYTIVSYNFTPPSVK